MRAISFSVLLIYFRTSDGNVKVSIFFQISNSVYETLSCHQRAVKRKLSEFSRDSRAKLLTAFVKFELIECVVSGTLKFAVLFSRYRILRLKMTRYFECFLSENLLATLDCIVDKFTYVIF